MAAILKDCLTILKYVEDNKLNQIAELKLL